MPTGSRGSAPPCPSSRSSRSSSGRSATSRSRLFEQHAQRRLVCQLRAFSSVPRGARIADRSPHSDSTRASRVAATVIASPAPAHAVSPAPATSYMPWRRRKRNGQQRHLDQAPAGQRSDHDDDGRQAGIDDGAVAVGVARKRRLVARSAGASSRRSDLRLDRGDEQAVADRRRDDSISLDSERSSTRRGDRVRTNDLAAATPGPGSSGARNSTACAPASSSIASARSEFASTCHAFRPEALPIDT